MSELWVFGYGSLMWRPGFPYLEAVHASLAGRHRALCVYSVHYRGSSARPGLVFGLDRGGTCEGMAFRVAAGDAEATRAYLRAREQVTGVYRARDLRVQLLEGRGQNVQALGYIADREHPQYAGALSLACQAAIVRRAVGAMGRNLDYVMSTLRHLQELGIHDPDLHRLAVMMGPRARLARSASSQAPFTSVPMRWAAAAELAAFPVRALPPDKTLRRNHRRNLDL